MWRRFGPNEAPGETRIFATQVQTLLTIANAGPRSVQVRISAKSRTPAAFATMRISHGSLLAALP